MTASIILFLVILGLAGWVTLELGFPKGSGQSSKQSMPMELATANMWCSEKLFRCQKPAKFVFKPDRVYKSAEGVLIVEETKTHDRVYASDVLQLSVAATGLRSIAGLPVADYGYVRLVTDRGRRTEFKKVRLFTDREVVAIHNRRQAILNGEITPSKSCQTGLCGGCAYRGAC